MRVTLDPLLGDWRLKWELSGGTEPSACGVCSNPRQLVSELNSRTSSCVQRIGEWVITGKPSPTFGVGSVGKKKEAVSVLSSEELQWERYFMERREKIKEGFQMCSE